MYPSGVKCVQANACLFRAANLPCTSGSPSKNCRNWGPTRAPTAPRLTTNVIQKIKESQKAAPTLFQDTPLVVFHPYSPAFSTSVLTKGDEFPALPARADTAHAAPALTKTASPDPATPAAVGSRKMSLNYARPIGGQITFPIPPAKPDNDVTFVASFGRSGCNSDNVDSAKNSPTRSSNTPYLEGHNSKLETIHKVLEGDTDAIFQPTVRFSHTDELGILELADAKTCAPKNL